jgi:hypothetical protein
VPESGKVREHTDLFRYSAFGKRGLGLSTRRVYSIMKQHQVTCVRRIRQLTGLARTTVWLAVQRLQKAGLVFDDTVYDGEYAERLQDAAARRLGVFGATARIKEIFAEQRLIYRTWLNRTRPRVIGYRVGGVFHALAA